MMEQRDKARAEIVKLEDRMVELCQEYEAELTEARADLSIKRKALDAVIVQRNEARAEVERLKTPEHNPSLEAQLARFQTTVDHLKDEVAKEKERRAESERCEGLLHDKLAEVIKVRVSEKARADAAEGDSTSWAYANKQAVRAEKAEAEAESYRQALADMPCQHNFTPSMQSGCKCPTCKAREGQGDE